VIRALQIVVLLVVLIPSYLSAEQGITVPNSAPQGFKPLFDELPESSPLNSVRPDLIDTVKPSFVKDTLMIDFESRQVTFSRFDTLSGLPLWEFHYAELGDYLTAMERHTTHALSKKILVPQGKKKKNTSDAPLTLALPAHLPAWATRILGKEPPKLSITGSQKFKIGYKKSKVGVNGVVDTTQSSGDFLFLPTSNFVIRGSVGRLLKLEIRMTGSSSKEVFESADDQLQNIKIEYKEEIAGELEDDIIQEVVIGKTNFNMPGQGLAGYSTGSNDGLFGIKVRSQIGPLALTTIASIEQTEKQSKSIDLNGKDTPIEVGEAAMKENLYFFLDEVYRLKYLGLFSDQSYYNTYLKSKNWTSAPKIKTVDVYKRIIGTNKPTTAGKIYDWAQYKTYSVSNGVTRVDSNTAIFEKLKADVDYRIDDNTGWISFSNPLQDEDLVAIYYEGIDSENKLYSKGNKTVVEDLQMGISKLKDLWVMKNAKSQHAVGDSTYDLMLRNVYSFSSNSATPDFSIKRKVGEKEYREKNDAGVFYAKILGLMDENDNFLYKNQYIFDLTKGYVLIPPYKKKSDADTAFNARTAFYPFSNPELGATGGEQNFGSIIYDERSSTPWTNRFSMITTNKEKTTSFSLDFGVMEQSETIKAGGVLLVRDEDYTIDYSMGFVDLISTRARSADRIEAEYQKTSLFFLEKKVFLGINGKVNLPGIGRNSYVGTTFMWQLMDTKSMMPKVGTEPFDRFLFDANIELDFEPAWMTALVNMIPLISSDVASSARFSFEIARSKTTSSTKNDGEAYIDNFSTSARTYTLGTSQEQWKKASPSYDWTEDETSWAENPPAWNHYWFQPVEGDNRSNDEEIFPPEKDANGREKNTDQKINTLRMVVQPFPEDSTLRAGVTVLKNGVPTSVVKPWAGIMRGFNGSLRNRKNDRYFEFWVRSPAWKSGAYRPGELIVDLGKVSEDISLDGGVPNRVGDFEVINEILTEANDFGVDHVSDTAESWFYPEYKENSYLLRQLKYGDPLLGKVRVNDPGNDNFERYTKDTKDNAPFANGTQNNLKNQQYAMPDNEDVSGDGVIYPAEGDFFRFKIDLSNVKNSKFVSRTDVAHQPEQGWIKIKIPVGDNATSDMIDSTVRSASWEKIEHVRILWRGFDSTVVAKADFKDTLEFHGMQFVGNLWREQVEDSSRVGVVSAIVEDSRNTTGYRRPPEKPIETSNGKDPTNDYTLVLDFEGVERNKSGVVFRDFSGNQSMDLTNYRDLRFWAEDLNREITTSRNNWFVFRFGSNDSTYYEFKTRRLLNDSGFVFDNVGWNSTDGIVVNLRKFAELKDTWFKIHGERVNKVDTVFVDNNGDSLRIFTKTEQMPTASAVKWIGFGVYNGGGSDFMSRVRVNGLRATGMAEREGWAVRSEMNFGFADFLKANANFKYTDADFRSMSQEVHLKGNTAMSGGVSSEMQMAKFLPARAGVRLPVGASLNSTLLRPEMRPNSDISLRDEDNSADGFKDLDGSFADLITGNKSNSAETKSEEFQQTSKDYRIYTSYRKTVPSEKSLVNLTLDRFGTEYAYSVTENKTRNGVIPLNEMSLISKPDGMYHIAKNKSTAHSFALDYDLSPTTKFKKYSVWEPFKDAKSKKLNRKIKSMKLNLVPHKVSFDLIKMNYSTDSTYNSNFEARDTNYKFTPTEKLGISHYAEINYEPISPFTSATFSVNSKRDFDSFLKKWQSNGVDNFLEKGLFQFDPVWKDYGVLNMENNRDHKTQFRLTPDLLNWLSTPVTLSSNYGQGVDITQSSATMNGTLNSQFRFETTLRTRRLFEDLSSLGKSDKGFSKSMKAIASGLDKVDLENITFTYNGGMDVNASYMDINYLDQYLQGSSAQYYLWTLGLRDRSFSDIVTGKMDDRGQFGGVQHREGYYGKDGAQLNSSDRRSTKQSVELRTSIKVPDPIELTFDQLSLNWKRDYSVFQKIGKMDTTITWPEIKVTGSTPILKKVPTINAQFSSINLKTGYLYSKIQSRKSDYFIVPDSSARDVNQNLTFRYGLDPLIKIDGVMKKWKIDIGYSMGLIFDTTISSVERFVDTTGWTIFNQAGKKDITSNHAWSAGYKIPGKSGRTLKLFRDRVIEMKGDSRISLLVDFQKIKHAKTDFSQKNEEGTGPKVEKPWNDTNFKLNPRYEYDVTKNIGFLMYYSLTKTVADPEERLRKNSEFAAELTISF